MFYIYAIVFPAVIVIAGFYLNKIRPRGVWEYIDVLLRITPYLFIYALLLYFLDREDYLDSGWAFYSIMFFLVPVTLVMAITKSIRMAAK